MASWVLRIQHWGRRKGPDLHERGTIHDKPQDWQQTKKRSQDGMNGTKCISVPVLSSKVKLGEYPPSEWNILIPEGKGDSFLVEGPKSFCELRELSLMRDSSQGSKQKRNMPQIR